ncbi:hypothetical protein YC2023_075545 [Brassica napus]
MSWRQRGTYEHGGGSSENQCRRPGILKTHCFGLVAGDKCHDIADHFSYAGSRCHKWYQSPGKTL